MIDGTYELFRHHFAMPSHRIEVGHGGGEMEVAGVRGVLGSMLALLNGGATHVGVATDQVIESFRNDLFAGYKSSVGVDPAILGQFGILEDALAAMGLVVWPMVDLEADDALAAAAAAARSDPRVSRVLICTPDKDLAQCVRDTGSRGGAGGRGGAAVVQLDRRRRVVYDEAGVRAKFGVAPASVPDWLALVGDSADGYPGVPRWGPASAATVLARWGTIEAIPALAERWEVSVRGAAGLAAGLRERRGEALLYKDLATLRSEGTLLTSVDDLAWRGPEPELAAVCRRLDMPALAGRVVEAASGR